MSNWNISILDRSVYYHTLKILSGDRSYLSCRWKSGAINWVVYPAKKSEYHVQMRRWLKWLGDCHRTISYSFLCIVFFCVVLWLWLSRAPDLKQGIMWWPNRKLEPTLLVAHGVAVGYIKGKFKVVLFLFISHCCFQCINAQTNVTFKERANLGFDWFLFFQLQCVLHVLLLKGAPIL